jgi:hypothetical protein
MATPVLLAILKLKDHREKLVRIIAASSNSTSSSAVLPTPSARSDPPRSTSATRTSLDARDAAALAWMDQEELPPVAVARYYDRRRYNGDNCHWCGRRQWWRLKAEAGGWLCGWCHDPSLVWPDRVVEWKPGNLPEPEVTP